MCQRRRCPMYRPEPRTRRDSNRTRSQLPGTYVRASNNTGTRNPCRECRAHRLLPRPASREPPPLAPCAYSDTAGKINAINTPRYARLIRLRLLSLPRKTLCRHCSRLSKPTYASDVCNARGQEWGRVFRRIRRRSLLQRGRGSPTNSSIAAGSPGIGRSQFSNRFSARRHHLTPAPYPESLPGQSHPVRITPTECRNQCSPTPKSHNFWLVCPLALPHTYCGQNVCATSSRGSL
jgi:hypothetical protein